MTEKTVYGIGDATFQEVGGKALVEEFYLQMSTLNVSPIRLIWGWLCQTNFSVHRSRLTLLKV